MAGKKHHEQHGGSTVIDQEEQQPEAQQPEAAPAEASPEQADGTPAPAPRNGPTQQFVAMPAAFPSPLVKPLNGKNATHFYGPVVSGEAGLVQGQSILAYRFDIDGTKGAFGTTGAGVQLVFPAGTILWKVVSHVTTAFNGTTPALLIGSTAGASDVASVSLAAAGGTETPTAPAIMLTPAPNANGTVTVYVSISAAVTAGYAWVALLYIGRPANAWT